MDIASTLIGLGLLAVFVLPIFFLIWQQNTKEKNKLKKLKDLSSQNNLHLDTVEISENLFLGLDSAANRLLVVEPAKNMSHWVLNLSHITNSKVNLWHSPDHQESIKKISLEISKTKNTNKITEIIFYDEDDNLSNNASERLIIAKKWNQIINEKLSA